MLKTQTEMPVTMSLTRSARKPVLALSVLVALVVAVIAIALPGSGIHQSVPVARAAARPYYPLIQYRGTGATPLRPASQTAPRYVRAEHSYGAVP